MSQYKQEPSEKDLEDAVKFRADIHKEALGKIRLVKPDIDSVIDPYRVEDYFQWNWEYPGAWYLYVAIPEGYRSRDAFVQFLVKNTLDHYSGR
ncbi:MAG: hypothetical protein J5640_05505 [Bacteroidales bacterium]|nr:hypothetical protein [Bacteroidales bacterium]